MLIGLDIGGTKIEGVLLRKESLEVVKKYRIATPKEGYERFLTAVVSVIDELADGHVPLSIGVGCCGSCDSHTGLMQGANIGYLNGMPLLKDLRQKYSIPIALSNDANCLAISEYQTGAAKFAHNSCLAIIVGTGCGGGLIVNGDIVDGVNGLGGEIGHNPLPGYQEAIDGPQVTCYCGSTNCIESFCSGRGFERSYALTHSPLSAKEIFALAAQGDINAIQHVEKYCDQLARVIASLVNVIDPEVVVLGGGMSSQSCIYPQISQRIPLYTFRKNIDVTVVAAQNGDASGVIGAALLPVLKKQINL